MSDRERIKTEVAAMSDEALLAKLDAGLFSVFEFPIAGRELEMRKANRLHTQIEAERLEAEAAADRQAQANAERWQADHVLTERSVIAAEDAAKAAAKQAIYAKRALDRSMTAIRVSIAAIIVSGFFALIQFLR